MNVFIAKTGVITAPIAKFRKFDSYDKNRNKNEVKVDIDFEKVTFSEDFFIDRMKSKDLKLIDFKVLDYILRSIEKNSDTVVLNPKIIVRYIPRGSSTISDSIKRLIKLEYINIVQGKRCKYQINPTKFFKGNRIDYLESINPYLIRQV